MCACGVHGCTGAECTGDAGEDCDEELDPEADVRAVLVGVGACDGAHGLPPFLVLIYASTTSGAAAVDDEGCVAVGHLEGTGVGAVAFSQGD